MRVFSAGNEAQLDEVFTRLVEHRIEGLLMSALTYFSRCSATNLFHWRHNTQFRLCTNGRTL